MRDIPYITINIVKKMIEEHQNSLSHVTLSSDLYPYIHVPDVEIRMIKTRRKCFVTLSFKENV